MADYLNQIEQLSKLGAVGILIAVLLGMSWWMYKVQMKRDDDNAYFVRATYEVNARIAAAMERSNDLAAAHMDWTQVHVEKQLDEVRATTSRIHSNVDSLHTKFDKSACIDAPRRDRHV